MPQFKKYKLGDVVDIVMGQSPEGNTCNKNNIGVPLLNGPTEFGDKFPTAVQYTTDPKKFSEEGDILFCVRGSTTGRMNFSDKQYAIGRGLAAIRHKKGKHLQSFVKGLIDSILPGMLQNVTGSTFPNLSKEQLNNYEVEIPEDLPTQTRIASILSSLDDKIELNRRTNHTLEQIAQTLFKKYFVDDIDPENLPEGWSISSLDKIADYLNGIALQKFRPKDEIHYLPVIKIKEMKNGISSSTEKASVDIPKQYIIQDGDILFSWSGSLEVEIWCHGKGALNQHLFKVSSTEYPKWFYYFWTKEHLQDFKNTAASKATTMGHIQRHHLTEAEVYIPPKTILEKADKEMSALLDKVILNRIEIKSLTQIRDSLLPKLMSGEIEVNTAEKELVDQ